LWGVAWNTINSPCGDATAAGTGRHGQLSLLKLSPSGYSNLNSATSRIVESMPMHGLKIDGKWGWVKSKFSLEYKKLFSRSATFFILSQPKWPKLQFSAYLVICIMGWVGFFLAIIKSGWHIKSQIRRSSLVSKYIVFWLKKRVWCLGSFLHIYCPLFSIKCSIKSEPNGGFLLIFQEILFLYIEGSRQKQRGK